ncbi:MAG: cation:proton antiporter [Bacteroidales bacterium]
MKKYRYLIYYILTIGGFSFLMYIVVLRGETLNSVSHEGAMNISILTGLGHFRDALKQNVSNALPLLLLQIITIISFARLFGYLCRKIGQPAVIGEIIAGIFLGPSVLGIIAPGVSGFIFPEGSLTVLQFFSQIGLILFMFIIGMDIDLKLLGNRAPEAFVVSHASIIIPFTLGMGLAYFIYTNLAPAGVPFLSFALFTGISLSITAFPVLARILQERNLIKTRVGVLAITCAAIDDISAWCLLAALIAIVKAGSFVSSLYTILISILYVVIMLKVIRPFLQRLGELYTRRSGISKPYVAIFIITLLISSYITEIIGIHAVFGAFVAGVIMPPNVSFRKILIEKIEDLAVILLLPIFFVISGLRTEIGLINSVYLWKITGLVILIAVAGKFAGSALSLKFVGQTWRNSLIIGTLMNTRGLMQLVVLSIGYDLGVLSPAVYTIMIIMALVTTMMAGPALDLIDRFNPEKKDQGRDNGLPDRFRVLISFGNPDNGRLMLKLAGSFINKRSELISITLLHLSQGSDLHKFNAEEDELESFMPLRSEADSLGIRIGTIFKTSQDIERDIIETANSGNYDLIIAGKAHTLYEGSMIGKMLQIITRVTNPGRIYNSIRGTEKLFSRSVFDGPTRRLVRSIKIPTGIFIDNNFIDASNVIVPVYSAEDVFIFYHASRLGLNNGSRINILDFYNQIEYNEEMKRSLEDLKSACPESVETILPERIYETLSSEYDLLLVSLDGWQKFVHDKHISYMPSALIIKPQQS